MEKLKHGSYVYKMEIPVRVHYSMREDGSISIDCVNAPEDIYKIIDSHAREIKAGAEVRG